MIDLTGQMSVSGIEGMQKLAQQVPKEVDAVLREEMGKVVRECIKNTPPFPAGKGTGNGLEEAFYRGYRHISYDVSFIFKPVQELLFSEVLLSRQWAPIEAYGMQFENPRIEHLYQQQNIDALIKVFKADQKPTSGTPLNYVGVPSAELHYTQRQRGEVENDASGYHVRNKEAVRFYTSIVGEYIGRMAGGWFTCLNDLGQGGLEYRLPQKGSGGAKVVVSSEKVTVEARNDYGGFADILSNNVDLQQLLDTSADRASDKLSKRLQQIIAQQESSPAAGGDKPSGK